MYGKVDDNMSWTCNSPRLFSRERLGTWGLITAGMPSWLRITICAGILFLTQWSALPVAHQDLDLVPTIIAAKMAELGQWEDIYPPPTPDGKEASAKIWKARVAQNGFGALDVGRFTYHPYYLSAAQPIVSRFSNDAIRKGVVAVNRIATVLVAFEISLMLTASGLAGQLLITLMLASCSTIISAIQFGQNTIVALALAMAALRLWSYGRGTTSLVVATLLAGIAWACKPWCVLLLPFCLAFRPARASVPAIAVACVVMVALPYAIYPEVLMTHYTAFGAELARTTVPGILNLSILISLERLTDPSLLGRLFDFGQIEPTMTLRSLSVAIAVLCVLLSLIAIIKRRPPAVWVIATGLGLMLLPLGVAWTHYFSFAIPIAALGSCADHGSRTLRILSLGLLIQLVRLEHWFLFDFDRSSPWPLVLPVVSVASVSVLALWLVPSARSYPPERSVASAV